MFTYHAFFVLLFQIARAQDYRPNADCFNTVENDQVRTNCPGHPALPQRYFLPDYFAVDLLPPEINWLTVETGVVATRFDPLATRENLTKVTFRQFNQLKNDPRFPVGRLFSNVKHFIRNLELIDVKLLSLSSDDFAGFDQLQRLTLSRCDISRIDRGAFDQLGLRPQISFLSIVANPDLHSFEWSSLRPLNGTLRTLQLSQNGLQSDQLNSTSAVSLPTLTELDLQNNNLQFLPPDVYNSLANGSNLAIKLAGNPLCGETPEGPKNCSCCEMYFFQRWMKYIGTVKADGILCRSFDWNYTIGVPFKNLEYPKGLCKFFKNDKSASFSTKFHFR